MPKIQGNAVQLHPAAVVFAIIVGGSLAGLLGAILALPVTAAFRDVVRYLFRRLVARRAGGPGGVARRRSAWAPDRCLTGIDPYKILQVDSEAEDEVIQAAYRRLARKYHPDLAATPEAATRMAAINAAWELIGDPAARRAFDRARRAADGCRRRADRLATAGGTARGRRGRRRPSGAADAAAAIGRPPPPEVVSRDWTSGRSTPGRRLRRVDARGRGVRCRRARRRAGRPGRS